MALNVGNFILNDWSNILFALIVVYIVKYYFSWYTRENPIPGPFPLPLIGNLHQLGLDMGKGALKLQKEYGDMFEIFLGPTRTIFISRAELTEKINNPTLKNNAFYFRSPPNPGLKELHLINSGITFNRDLTTWKFNRRILNLTVMSPKFLRKSVEFTNQLCDDLEKYWSSIDPNTKVNLANWTTCLSADIIVTTATGTKGCSMADYNNSLPNSVKVDISEKFLNESLKFIDSIYTLISSALFYFSFPPFIRKYFPVFKPMYHKYRDNDIWLGAELERIVCTRKQKIESASLDQPIESNALNLLIVLNTERDINKITSIDFTEPLTNIEISRNLKEIFVGGMDTTRNVMCFIMYYINKHPQVKDKLIKEYESVYGDLSKKIDITYESLGKLVYTEAVINESMRLTPVLPVFLRAASFDTEIGGYKIKKDTTVFTNYTGIHYHKDHWVEPEKFNPDRFLKDGGHTIVKNSYLPFGGGIRICPGRHWAMGNMKILSARMLTNFEINLADPEAPLKSSYQGTQHCDELDGNDDNLKNDLDEANYWYHQAVDGNKVALYRLGELYEIGKGVCKNLVRAFEFYKESANKGCLEAQYKVGYYYDHGLVVDADKEKALDWYEIAAERGSIDAQHRLACQQEVNQS
ncbi:17500_t:CDS:2 [Funneliformis geosporum]|uniref:17500_t:CDS:1 n=1 Tax=Funneliformis geosporum TaxID=1117311 RepID=A0A9W4SMN5_9GLOM|nr:17500_t:CDS:2 [Funneliformis geosporum]